MTAPLLIVVGASAGGIPALIDLIPRLPVDFAATILIVIHMSPDVESYLDQILRANSRLPISQAKDGELIQPGHIYCAVPDHHLLVEGEQLIVKRGPKENRFRPSIDALFRSAAYSHTTRVVGVVLSGMLDDGTSGLWTIKRLGGQALVQDPQEAGFDSMPLSALKHVEVDGILFLAALARWLIAWVESQHEPDQLREPESRMTEAEWQRLKLETGIAKDGRGLQRNVLRLGPPSLYACPECHGMLLQLNEGDRTRYRCHTGHAYSSSALLSHITEKAQSLLGQARRANEETALLLNALGDEYAARGEHTAAQNFREQARLSEDASLELLTLENRTPVLSELKRKEER